MDADAHTSSPSPSKPKGQRMLTWDEPGEWIADPEQQLKYCAVPMGVDDRGAATLMLVVKYEPGAHIGPHFHHSDYASIVVAGSIEVTRRNHEVGSIRVVNQGTVYGPLIAGPDGCTVIDVFATGVPDPSVTAMNTYV